MGLKMTFGRGDARFEYSDGEVESSVTINAADDPEAVLRKLKRVIALVEGERSQALEYKPFNPSRGGIFPPPPVAAEPPQLGPEQAANGWELLGADDLQDAPGESG